MNNSGSRVQDTQWGNLEVEFSLICNREISLSLFSRKEICKEPYKLLLDISGDKKIEYSHILVNFAEVIYSSGEKTVLKDDNGQPLKCFFKEYYDSNTVFYYFKSQISKKHTDGEKITVRLSITLMPDNITKVFNGSFQGKTFKNSSSVLELIEGV